MSTPYSLTPVNLSLLKLIMQGDVDKYDALRLREELELYLEKSWLERRQVNVVADVSDLNRISAEARHLFASQNRDKRIGRVAVVGFTRAQKILAHFIMVESKRNNIYFFDTISEAESWLMERA
ncbi:MAG: STAS/SEC14 domain-containing protein [Chloroflexota bacterium]